jgi:hypothetical protein
VCSAALVARARKRRLLADDFPAFDVFSCCCLAQSSYLQPKDVTAAAISAYFFLFCTIHSPAIAANGFKAAGTARSSSARQERCGQLRPFHLA